MTTKSATGDGMADNDIKGSSGLVPILVGEEEANSPTYVEACKLKRVNWAGVLDSDMEEQPPPLPTGGGDGGEVPGGTGDIKVAVSSPSSPKRKTKPIRDINKFTCKRNYICGALVIGVLIGIACFILAHGSKEHTPPPACYKKDQTNISDMHDHSHTMPFRALTPIGLHVEPSSNVSLNIKTYENSSVLHLNLFWESGLSDPYWVIRGKKPDGDWLQGIAFNGTSHECIWRLNFVLNGMLLQVHLMDCEGLTHTLNFWSEQFQPRGLSLEASCTEHPDHYLVFWGCYKVKSRIETPKGECKFGPLNCGPAFSIFFVFFMVVVVVLVAIYHMADPQPFFSGHRNKYARIQITITEPDEDIEPKQII